MPFIATALPAFVALLTDVPYALKPYGRKLYVHISPTVEEPISLRQRGWKSDALMPGAYHGEHITQQWSLDITGEDVMRLMRVKQRFLDFIKKGEKTLEVRVAYDSLRTIQPGERIKLTSRTDSQTVRVNGIRSYQSLSEMLRHEEAGRIAPGQSREEVLSLLREFYPPNREKLGVLVLDIKPERA